MYVILKKQDIVYFDEKINVFDFAAQAEKFRELVQHPKIAVHNDSDKSNAQVKFLYQIK